MREIHIRRLRYDEARAKLDQEVNEAFVRGERYIEIVHGIGGGVLQKMAREYVDSSEFLKLLPDASNPGVLRVEVLAPDLRTIKSLLRDP
ncbi:MAG: Smr/MutS family protein [Leptospirales bacterium]|nr:Smr/MutS family protein [Leptospirales bacterium]